MNAGAPWGFGGGGRIKGREEREETLCARVSGRVGGKDGWIRGGECWRPVHQCVFLQHKYAIEGEIEELKRTDRNQDELICPREELR
jgi:hypothetical protein